MIVRLFTIRPFVPSPDREYHAADVAQDERLAVPRRLDLPLVVDTDQFRQPRDGVRVVGDDERRAGGLAAEEINVLDGERRSGSERQLRPGGNRERMGGSLRGSPFAIAGQPERPLKTNGTYGAASPKSMDVPGPKVAGPSNAGR